MHNSSASGPAQQQWAKRHRDQPPGPDDVKRHCPYPDSLIGRELHAGAAAGGPVTYDTPSRFDAEFGDDFSSSDLDRIMALTDAALKTSGLPPLEYAAPPASGPVQSGQSSRGGNASLQQFHSSKAQPHPSPYLSDAQSAAFPVSNTAPFVVPQTPVCDPVRPATAFQTPGSLADTQRFSSSAISNGTSLPLHTVLQLGIGVPVCQNNEDEVKRLRSSLISCSHDRAQLRLQQKKLQGQIAEKSGALTMLRSKLNATESQFHQLRTETSLRLAQASEAHRAQHERMRAQIDSLNVEREAIERELEEIGRSNESLTRALSAERQAAQVLKRQLAVVCESQNTTPKALLTSPDACPKCSNAGSRIPASIMNHYGATPAIKQPLRNQVHLESYSISSKILSTALEDGLVDLIRSPDWCDLIGPNDEGDAESTLSLLLNDSYPSYCALPVLNRVIVSGKAPILLPALKLLHTLVTSSGLCRSALLGEKSPVANPRHVIMSRIMDTLPVVANPFWTKPGSCLVVPSSFRDHVEQSSNFTNYSTQQETNTFSSSIVHCPELVDALFNLMDHRSSLQDVDQYTLLIILTLAQQCDSAQIRRFGVLLTSGAIPRQLFNPETSGLCRSLLLRLLTVLMHSANDLQALVDYGNGGNSDFPALMHYIQLCFTYVGHGIDTKEQSFGVRMAAVDLIGHIVGSFGNRGITAVSLDPIASMEAGAAVEYQILPRLALMMTAELDRYIHEPIAKSEGAMALIYKGLLLNEALIPFVSVSWQVVGYRLVFLSLLTRLMQVPNADLADHAGAIRSELLRLGCLDVLHDPGESTSQDPTAMSDLVMA